MIIRRKKTRDFSFTEVYSILYNIVHVHWLREKLSSSLSVLLVSARPTAVESQRAITVLYLAFAEHYTTLRVK